MLLGYWLDTDEFGLAQVAVEFANQLALELYNTVYQSVQGGITCYFDIVAGVEFSAVLADNDFTFLYPLVAEDFYAKAFGD